MYVGVNVIRFLDWRKFVWGVVYLKNFIRKYKGVNIIKNVDINIILEMEYFII